MKLNKLSTQDKDIFRHYLSLARHELAVYAFANIYIWKRLFAIRWQVIEDSLCIFFQDKMGCFLYLPPLGEIRNPQVIQTVFALMDKLNQNKELSRIENAERDDLGFYQRLGYTCALKSDDYLCSRSALANLKGNKFKSQRASVNYFLKHYQFELLPFSLKDKDACLQLYRHWMKKRRARQGHPIYQAMLKDNFSAFRVLMDDYQSLDMVGKIVKVEGKLRAFTFGFKLPPETFCVLYEVTDLSFKGLSQFIFRELCRQLIEEQYINIMDDSGLENLQKVKLTYHPARLIPAYIVKRQ